MTRPPAVIPGSVLLSTMLLVLALAGCGPSSPTPFPSASSEAPASFDQASFGWWVADRTFEADGQVHRYRLRVGLLDSTEARGEDTVELAPWALRVPGLRGSAVVGPASGRIAYVSDDGLTTELRVAHVTGEVGRAVASFPEVVWAMAIDPRGSTAYAVLLDRLTGDDRGVWRVPLDEGDPPAKILPASTRGIATRAENGIRLVAVVRFVRELVVSIDGTLLVRRACGEPFGQCDLDVLSLVTGDLRHFAETEVTELLGVVDGLVVGGHECPEPTSCRRTALDLSTGAMRAIAPSDGRDRIAVGDDGRALHVLMEETAGQPTRSFLRVTDLRTGARWAATEPNADLWYQPPFNPDEIGVELPHGWILVSVGAATAIHLESGSSHLLELPTPEPIGAFNG